MRNTFLNLFPNYKVSPGEKVTTMKSAYVFPKTSAEGLPVIDRTFNRKKDFIKVYHESMLRVASMKRAW